MKPDSIAVHAGHEPKARDPLSPAIVQSSVWVYESLDDYDLVASGEVPGSYYARNGTDNSAMLEAAVAALEGAPAALAAASGMAAILAAILALAPKPAPIVMPLDVYGTTLTLVRQDLGSLGYEARIADLENEEETAEALRGAGLVICETVTNPICRVTDLDRLSALARASGVPLLVDNTFATPIFCRPLEHGATAVVHSATKFLGGHSDVVAGVVAAAEPVVEAARGKAVRFGTTLGAFEAWLCTRGLRTLALRARRQSANALSLARALQAIPAVGGVHHPGLDGSPYRERAERLLPEGTGAMLAFDLDGREAVQAMLGRLRMVRFAASLGGVETTVSHPEITSHRGLTPEERTRLGIGPGTVRVSTGIEDPEDIVDDFRRALG